MSPDNARAAAIDAQWIELGRLAALNPGQIVRLDRRSSPVRDIMRVRLLASPALIGADAGPAGRRDEHTLRLEFPRAFPAVPLECFVDDPVFHPNVRPGTGFMCLWADARPEDGGVVQAVARAQALLAYRMVTIVEPHVLNREAAAWYDVVGRPQQRLPLTWDEIALPDLRVPAP